MLTERLKQYHVILASGSPRRRELMQMLGVDFVVKTIGARNISSSRIESFQMGIEKKYQDALFSRTLLLNCVNKYYSELWESGWRDFARARRHPCGT